jgi:hypothetical protein
MYQQREYRPRGFRARNTQQEAGPQDQYQPQYQQQEQVLSNQQPFTRKPLLNMWAYLRNKDVMVTWREGENEGEISERKYRVMNCDGNWIMLQYDGISTIYSLEDIQKIEMVPYKDRNYEQPNLTD